MTDWDPEAFETALLADMRANGGAVTRTFKATASVTEPDDRRRLWDKHVEAMPQFAEYPKTANRVIQMVRLTPTV